MAETPDQRENAQTADRRQPPHSIYNPRALYLQPTGGVGEVEQTFRAVPSRVGPSATGRRSPGEYSHLCHGRPGRRYSPLVQAVLYNLKFCLTTTIQVNC